MKFDAIIIGSGQAGNPLSFRLTDLGWRVALIEMAEVGGTCVNTGCTPTKTMVHRAQIAHYARNAARWGVHAENVSADLKTIVAQKDKLVHSFRSRREEGIANRPNLQLFRGRARFVNSHQVQVGDALLESDKIFINTGGRARIPKIAGLDAVDFLTNQNIMDLTTIPEHLIVLGGGYIGLEFGQMFRRFGSRVTLIHAPDQIIPREDPEVANELQKILEAEGIKFYLGTRAMRAEQKGNSISIFVQGPAGASTVTGSHLLVAIGRQPNTDDLGLERAGVETDKAGFIKVNCRLETNVPGIWALGDVNGGPQFTHISYNDFQIVDANLTQGKNPSTEHRILLSALFTDPQLACVGITEQQARAGGYKLKIGSIPMSRVARAIERDETSGMMKVIVDASNDLILGASILSVEGGEIIHILYTLMLGRLPYTLLKGAIYIHPTLAEGLFTLLDSVKLVD
jgi:pyruvate/2-oxoglutarate dehydrogenase complex dihydrolipoamide dehydrogenase (E3) component